MRGLPPPKTRNEPGENGTWSKTHSEPLAGPWGRPQPAGEGSGPESQVRPPRPLRPAWPAAKGWDVMNPFLLKKIYLLRHSPSPWSPGYWGGGGDEPVLAPQGFRGVGVLLGKAGRGGGGGEMLRTEQRRAGTYGFWVYAAGAVRSAGVGPVGSEGILDPCCRRWRIGDGVCVGGGRGVSPGIILWFAGSASGSSVRAREGRAAIALVSPLGGRTWEATPLGGDGDGGRPMVGEGSWVASGFGSPQAGVRGRARSTRRARGGATRDGALALTQNESAWALGRPGVVVVVVG